MAENENGPGTVYWLIQSAADVAADDDWLAESERETLASLRVAKRRADWRLGRWTAKQAFVRVAALVGGVVPRLENIAIVADTAGAPRATVRGDAVPWRISISHSHGRGLCAVGPEDLAVGCDLERVEPRAAEFAREWFTRAEQDVLARKGPEDVPEFVTLVWSAKESALKATGVGLTVSTDRVSIAADEPTSDDGWRALSIERSGDPRPLRGWWRRDAGDLITIATVPACSRPVALSP